MLEVNEKLLKVLKNAESITVNHTYCENCKGLCCKRCGCTYLPSDFEEFSYSFMKEKLKEGKISIVASMNFDLDKHNRVIAKPLFYLRARNRGREVVDLFSYKSRCTQLTPTGCAYEDHERPSFAQALIPTSKGLLAEEGGCYSLFDEYGEEVRESWLYYQNVLAKLVEDFSGKTVKEAVNEQLILLENIVHKNLDSIIKKEETLELLDMLHGVAQSKSLQIPSTKGYQKMK